jgi:hypothetical protein
MTAFLKHYDNKKGLYIHQTDKNFIAFVLSNYKYFFYLGLGLGLGLVLGFSVRVRS